MSRSLALLLSVFIAVPLALGSPLAATAEVPDAGSPVADASAEIPDADQVADAPEIVEPPTGDQESPLDVPDARAEGSDSPTPAPSAAVMAAATQSSTFTADVAGSFTPVFSGVASYVAVAAGSSLPPGLSLDNNTGVISGTPSRAGAGITSVVLNVDDADGRTSTNIVVDIEVLAAPFFRFPEPLTLREGVRSDFLVVVEAGWPYVAVISLDVLVPGVSIAFVNGTPTAIEVGFSGTPEAGAAGDYVMSWSASNNADLHANAQMVVNVLPPFVAPQLTGDSAIDLLEGEPAAYVPSLTQGDPNDATVSIASGTLPAGLSLDPATGAISGTPEMGSAGTYDVTLVARGSDGPPSLPLPVRITVTAQAPFVLESSSGTLTGGEFVVSGGGLIPGSTVAIELHSTPVLLGTVTADASGTFSLRVPALPAGIAFGAHRIVATATSPGGVVRVAELAVTVPRPVTAVQPTALPATGADSAGPLAAATLLLVTGGVMMMHRRRSAA
ncbi:Ig domain-containing protein [Cryobacterium sp. BB736]|uniref:Ig domain-containing protein n=1 Tax=Cryobacterium sp. BB736 TaxID=2746963 RepID=UPI001874EDC5